MVRSQLTQTTSSRSLRLACALLAIATLLSIPRSSSAFGHKNYDCPFCGCVIAGCPCKLSKWRASVDVAFLGRDRPGNVPIYTTGAGASIFSASDFEFDFKTGLDTTLTWQMTPVFATETRYLWVDGWTDAPGSFAVGAGDQWMLNPPIPAVDATVTPTYLSQFESIELNFRRKVGHADISLGVRYARFGERYQEEAVTPVGAAETSIFSAGNDMVGLQLGIGAARWHISPHLYFTGFARAGAYYNNANSKALVITPIFPLLARADNDHVAFLGEVKVQLACQITRKWSARCGYQAIWLDGVATAAEQIPQTTFTLADPWVTVTDVKNSLFFHGFTSGVECRF